MNQLVVIISIIMFSFNVKAQRAQAFYLEALGSGLFYSANYDLRFLNQPYGLGMRLGFSRLQLEGTFHSFPVQLNYIFGERKHRFEAGAGVLASVTSDLSGNQVFQVVSGASFCYRYQPLANGLLFRFGWTPTFMKKESNNPYDLSSIFRYWPGISIGYNFYR